ncbi:MAG TPA: transporter substrate-binding domain-containing protein [Gaiellaceae bacterium]|nr:transporter substrate-binding domain-containing protein [Gaiellaceae bacterium]
MRKTVLLSLLTLVAVSLAAAGTAGASRHVATGTSFKYCDNPTFPPMENTTKSGKPVGFDIDFAAALGKQLGGTAKYVFSSFSGLLPALGAKRCDVVISGIFITPDRTKQFPAVAYMHSHRALIVAGGNPKKITSPAKLAGMSVAVQAGTKYEQYLKSLQGKTKFTLNSYPGDTDAIGQILIGRADAVLSQDTSAAFAMSQHPGKVAIGYLFPQTDAFGVYYRKGEAIGGQIAAAIKALKANGTLAKLAVKYHIPVGDVK